MADKPVTVMLVAGEASGDLHAASVFRELKKRLPGLRGIGMGGPHMVEAGIDVRVDSTSIAVMGLSEVLKHYGKIRRVLRSMQRLACEEKPDLLICVDYKEFNLRLAQKAKACGVKVLFYVSPQVWAWRPGRVKTYGRAIDAMAVLFPFEVPFYQAHDIPCRYVGHPLAGKVQPVMSKPEAQRHFGFDPAIPLIGFLPGSRAEEVRRLLPVMVASARLLQKRLGAVQFVLIQAKSVDQAQLTPALAASPVPVRIIQGQSHEVLQCCDAVLTSSGTATLELAILGIPMAIIYKLMPFTYYLARWLVRVSYIGLPNIIAGKGIVREFIQHRANAQALAAEIEKILTDSAYASRIRQDLAAVRQQLGPAGGSENLALMALEMLGK